MTEPQSKRAHGWLGAPADVNVVSIAVLAGVWVLVHEVLLTGNPAGTWGERAYLQVVLLVQSAWLTMCTVLAVALFSGAGLRRAARAVTAVSFGGSGAPLHRRARAGAYRPAPR